MLSCKKEKKTSSKMIVLEDILEALKRNEIKMELLGSRGDIAPNASKIGGKPFLPADFAWPYYEGESLDGEMAARPLSFLAQINLDEVKRFDEENLLPQKGMLYFFYECETMKWGFDPKDKGCARVIYRESTDGFAPLEAPGSLSEEYAVKETAVSFSCGASFPRYDEFALHSGFKPDFEKYDEVATGMGAVPLFERSKILGYGDMIQNEMLTECERVSRGIYCGNAESYKNISAEEKDAIKKAATDWILLLQLSSFGSGEAELMWGDCGNIYFYIKKQDLSEKNFENVWLILQC